MSEDKVVNVCKYVSEFDQSSA